MKKIYRISVSITTEQTTYIEADNGQEAHEKAELLYNGDSGLEYEWGSEEISHDIGVKVEVPKGAEPDYRGDALKIAEANAHAYAALDCQYPSEDSNACMVHNKEH